MYELSGRRAGHYVAGKWLKAGVLEQGQLSYPGSGTPQGGVISPTLSKNRPEAAVSTYQYRLLNEAKSIAATASSAPG